MNANIKIKNNKLINNEPVGDIYVKSSKSLKLLIVNLKLTVEL